MGQPKDFGFGEDEQLVRDAARKFLRDHAGIETLRRLVADDHHAAYESATPPVRFDDALWRHMIELGWAGLAVPTAAGGAGMKMVAVAALAEEVGRVALPSPLIVTLLASCVLREAPGAAAHGWLTRVAAGLPTTLAITDAAGSWEADHSSVAATAAADGATLDGTAWFVQDARKVSAFIVSATSPAGVGLYAVPADAPGVTIHPDRIVDLTRDQARVEFREVRVPMANVIAAAGSGADVLRRAMPALLTIVAADMSGAGEWQLQTTAEYARARTQFERPLGFFQAVKHPLVNMMLAIDQARSLVYAAACAIDSEPQRAEYYARLAKASASDMAAFCSGRSVQLHGGIGFTWECDVHLYFKRQQHNQMLYGDATYQRAKLATIYDDVASPAEDS